MAGWAWLKGLPWWVWVLWAGMLPIGWLIGAAVDRRRLAREVAALQGRLAEARTARLDLLVHLDRAASSAAVLRRERDAMVETAAGVAKLARLDALRPRSTAESTAESARFSPHQPDAGSIRPR